MTTSMKWSMLIALCYYEGDPAEEIGLVENIIVQNLLNFIDSKVIFVFLIRSVMNAICNKKSE